MAGMTAARSFTSRATGGDRFTVLLAFWTRPVSADSTCSAFPLTLLHNGIMSLHSRYVSHLEWGTCQLITEPSG